MIEPQRILPENKDPLDEEFSIKECAVKRTDSKKSTDDETSYTSCTSAATTTDDLTSGLSQDIKPHSKLINNKQMADQSMADFAFADQFQMTNNFSLGADLKNHHNNKAQQQQQFLQQQQQQNLHQLLQTQKIQSNLSSNSAYSVGLDYKNLKNQQIKYQQQQQQQQQKQQQHQQQTTNQYTSISSGNQLTKSGQLIPEQFHNQQNGQFYTPNSSQPNSRASSIKQQQMQQIQMISQPQQIQPQQQQPKLVQVQQTNVPIQNKFQPAQVQQNSNSHYSANYADMHTVSQQNLHKPIQQKQQQQPILTKQISMDNNLLKSSSNYYSMASDLNRYSPKSSINMQPIVQHQPQHTPQPVQQQQQHTVTPNLTQQISTPSSTPKQTATATEQTNLEKQNKLSEKAKSFSEYKAYLDYLKNGAPQKRFDVQVETSKMSTSKTAPKDSVIIRQYNPNEGAAVNLNSNNLKISSNLKSSSNLNTSSNNLNTYMKPNINENLVQQYPQQSYSHHTPQMQSHSQIRMNLNPGPQYGSRASLMQPSYHTFSFNTNQNFMNNKNAYYPTLTQRIIKNNYPMQNNIHSGFFPGY